MISASSPSGHKPSTATTACSARDTALIVTTAVPLAEVRTGHCQCGHITYTVAGIPDDPHTCFPDD